MTGIPMLTIRDTTLTFELVVHLHAIAPQLGSFFIYTYGGILYESGDQKKLTGIMVGLIVLGGFLTGLFGMMFSEKNREYFINRIKNIKNVPFIRHDKDPTK